MQAAIARFDAAGIRTASGRPIAIKVTGASPATRWKKSSEVSRNRSSGHPRRLLGVAIRGPVEIPAQYKSAMTEACQPTIYSPAALPCGGPMAEALAGRRSLFPGRRSSTSPPIHRVGAAMAIPMGKLKLGYTHPKYSSAGLLFMTSIPTGSPHEHRPDARSGLCATGHPGLCRVAQNTAKYGMVTTALLDMMARQDPIIFMPFRRSRKGWCATTWSTPANCVFPLAFIFPAEGTFWSDHPYCILTAPSG